jgi:hypothetical protein
MRLTFGASAAAVLLVGGLAACSSPRPAAQPRMLPPLAVTDDSRGGPARGVVLPDQQPALVDDAVGGLPTAAGSASASPASISPASASPAGVTVRRTVEPGSTAAPSRRPQTALSPSPHQVVVSVPASGTRTFTSADSGTPVVGDGSELVTYRVQVEGGIPTWTPDKFAGVVDTILADSRSWRASHTWSFQRVDTSVTPSVFIRLATPDTVDYLCGTAWINTQGIYSCRYGKYVVINLLRWVFGAAGYESNLPAYRAMVVNHETGHFLGYSHMACPGAGMLAPVMQTQTIALNGCLPNSWPYPDGVHFVSGPPAPA